MAEIFRHLNMGPLKLMEGSHYSRNLQKSQQHIGISSIDSSPTHYKDCCCTVLHVLKKLNKTIRSDALNHTSLNPELL